MADTNKTEQALSEFSKRELGDVKVLMVEDDTFFSELVLSKLSENGCIPYSTGTGEEALELARQYHPDIIILDLMLPGLQGEEVIKQLKADEELKDIPIVVFSNKSNAADIEHNLSIGATEFLVKSSTDLSTLTEVVQRVLKKE